MKSKTKYLLLILSIVGLSLMIFNNVKMYYWASIIEELEFAKISFAIGILSLGLYYLVKKWRNRLTKIMIIAFGVCLVLNLYLTAEYYKSIQIQNRLSEYSKFDTCEEMEKRFATDLKDGKLKYFSFGLISDNELTKRMKTNFGIDNFNLGCTVYSEKICYNKLVENHIKNKYGKSINEILK